MEGSIAFVDNAAPGGDEGNPILNLTDDGVYLSLAQKIWLVGQKMLTEKSLEIKGLFTIPQIQIILERIALENDPNFGVFQNYKNMLKDKYKGQLYLDEHQFGIYFTDFVLLRVLLFCGYNEEEIVRFFLYDGRHMDDTHLGRYYRNVIAEIDRHKPFRITEREKQAMDYGQDSVVTDAEDATDEEEGGDSDFVLDSDDDDNFWSGGGD